MRHVLIFLIANLTGVTTATATPHPTTTKDEIKAPSKGGFTSTIINIGNTTVGIDTRGNIQIHTPTGKFVAPLDSIISGGPTDLYIDPRLLKGPGRPARRFGSAYSPWSKKGSGAYF